MSFERSLSRGLAGESAIARWLRRRGFSVLPAYQTMLDTGKGPQLYTPDCTLITPDMLVFKGNRVLWIEAKRKTAFAWNRQRGCWVTGIDLRHYSDYCRVEDCSPWPVWLLFLHEGGQAKDSPADSPAGLFGNSLEYLRHNENHRSPKFGSGGMVYWDIGCLRLMATVDAVLPEEAMAL